MSAGDAHVILCIENELFRQYLEEQFLDREMKVTWAGRAELGAVIAERPSGILVLQSDTAEDEMIGMAARLRHLFGDEIRILLLSSDYTTAEEAGSAVDEFLQFPLPFDELDAAIRKLSDRTRRILIVDDSKLVHSHLAAPLRAEGYEVFDAYDGREGYDATVRVRPDLVICDVEMPHMNGLEVCAAIRQNPDVAGTYIIMSSTLGSAADQQKGFQAGVDEYLAKPVDVGELLDRVKAIFRSCQTRGESILLLDADETMGKWVAKSLAKQGFTTRATVGIRDALKSLKRLSCDLVIADSNAKDGTVIDLFGGLRGLPPDRCPHVLVMTSRENLAEAKMARNAGAAAVVSKPFTMDSLLASVERVLADRRARNERAQLTKYLSKASLQIALEKSLLSGSTPAARAYRRHATVFFSDVIGFTSRCERYSPREIVTQINILFDTMTRVILESEGDVDKFIGDACMAYWLDEDDDEGRGGNGASHADNGGADAGKGAGGYAAASADRAIGAVLRLGPALAALNAGNPVLASDPLRIRIGVNSGDIILCDIGSADARMNLTVIGDPVNVAARFESAAKQYGVDALIGGPTIRNLLHKYAARLIDRVVVKGKTESIECYELLGERAGVSAREEQLLAAFHEAMAEYHAGRFEQAVPLFERAEAFEANSGTGEANPSRVYVDRCRQLIERRPEDWQGLWELQMK